MKRRIKANADKTTPEKLLNLRNLNQLKKNKYNAILFHIFLNFSSLHNN